MATADQLLENQINVDASVSDEEQASTALKLEQEEEAGDSTSLGQLSENWTLLILRLRRKHGTGKLSFAMIGCICALFVCIQQLGYSGSDASMGSIQRPLPAPIPTSEPADLSYSSDALADDGTEGSYDGPAAGGLTDGFCGVTSNPSLCAKDTSYLHTINVSANIFCNECGGEDPCTFALDDETAGMNKDPRQCQWSPGVIFLWDQPETSGDGTGRHDGEFGDSRCGEESCEAWSAETWKRYVNKWHKELAFARRMGVRVTSPRFQGGDVLQKFNKFFNACPECAHKGSRYYIDMLAFSAFIKDVHHDNSNLAANVAWINGVARQLKSLYDRPVVLTEFGVFGGQTASLQAEAIERSGLFNPVGNEFSAVYYFAAVNFQTVKNFLNEVVETGPLTGSTIGQVLLKACTAIRGRNLAIQSK